jgi:hypothetical protein
VNPAGCSVSRLSVGVENDGTVSGCRRVAGVRADGSTRGKGTSEASRASRTDWMRSYVYPKGKEPGDEPIREGVGQDLCDAIDEAAIGAAIEYEKTRGFEVEQMPHHNPGFDIKSWHPETHEPRLIEVKGLRDEWTGRGVKLSRTQIMNAEEYGDEYWLYVVEFAIDPKQRKIHAIQNPFFKASEFWFDYVWREVADERGGDLKSRFVPGRWVKVEHFGTGEIIEVSHSGIVMNLVIEFSMHGLKFMQFDASRMELVED